MFLVWKSHGFLTERNFMSNLYLFSVKYLCSKVLKDLKGHVLSRKKSKKKIYEAQSLTKRLSICLVKKFVVQFGLFYHWSWVKKEYRHLAWSYSRSLSSKQSTHSDWLEIDNQMNIPFLGLTYFVGPKEQVEFTWFRIHRESTYKQSSNLRQWSKM